MGRKITMTGKNAQYIERRGVHSTPEDDREIIMEGDEAVYQEIADGTRTAGATESKILVQGDYVLNKHQETNNTLILGRQKIFDQLLTLADKGDWGNGVTSEKIKTMLKTILGLGETSLNNLEADLSEAMWHLLENGRGDRVKIVWQNLVGYFDDKRMFKQKGAPALNKDFFGDEDGYSNIDKGRPSRDNMSSGFHDILPLLDKYCPR